MAGKIKAVLGHEVTLIPSSGGVFDVKVDDDLVYSKHASGDFPDEDALVKEMKAKYS